ncbi:non-ribosomal peptide synthetase family protein, partial [Spongiimicrobium salis]|uniref:non-ribosomal peptide synthetase family protein n=1 Tax=Spongiimicrobium salis TaxID=1667022 RepID=UPI00374D9BD3
AAYVPIDMDNPESRISHIVGDSGCVTILGEGELERFVSSMEGYPDTPLGRVTGRDDTAYVIYTSGSTGRPKGVLVPHGGLSNLIRSQCSLYGIDATDRILQFSSLGFDASVEQIWIALCTGARLVLVDRGTLLDGELFGAYLTDQEITHLDITPSYLEGIGLGDHAPLRRVVCGGEECRAGLADRYSGKYDFYNAYGPTEATITTFMKHVRTEVGKGGRVPLGRPVANTYAYVLDGGLSLLPVGCIGELYISGAGVTKGYLNRPSLTGERFLPDPFREGCRLYRTGDLVRWLPDGDLEFIGRRDGQVKIRGYRVELGEIENMFHSYKDLLEQVIIDTHREHNNTFLVAYIVLTKTGNINEIKQRAFEDLPGYMVPSYYMPIETIPLTTNGKIDKSSLPSPRLEIGENLILPKTNIERALAEIWCDILSIGKEFIGINSNFFDLGGHSLNATKLVHSINEKFDVKIPLVDIFLAINLKELAKKIPLYKNDKTANIKELVRLKEVKKPKNNIFFIHDGSGDVHGYIKLIAQLKNYNCLGLCSKSIHHSYPMNMNVVDMASNYIDKIKKVQASGPYIIIGWSFGGILGYEIVKQLEKSGDEIKSLIMIDTDFTVNDEIKRREFNLESEKEFLRTNLQNNIANDNTFETMEELWNETVKVVSSSKMSFEEVQHRIPKYVYDLIPMEERDDPKMIIRTMNTVRSLERTLSGYTLNGKINTKISYFSALDSDCRYQDFSNFTNEMEVIQVQGDHFSMMKSPHVHELATIIMKHLAHSISNPLLD